MRAVINNRLPRVLQRAARAREKHGGMALHLACNQGHEGIVAALLDGKYDGCGVEVDALDAFGETPLMLACCWGQEGVVRLLLARGAKVATLCTDGLTALFQAAARLPPREAAPPARPCCARTAQRAEPL